MSPELIAIVVVDVTMIGLILAFWRDTRAEIQALREEVHADNQRLRQDVQALTERTSRVEGVIEGLFGERGGRERQDDAA